MSEPQGSVLEELIFHSWTATVGFSALASQSWNVPKQRNRSFGATTRSQDMSQIQNVNNLRHFLFVMWLSFLNTRWKSKWKQTHWELLLVTMIQIKFGSFFLARLRFQLLNTLQSEPAEIYGVTSKAWITEHAKRWFFFGRVELWAITTVQKKSFVSLILCWLAAHRRQLLSLFIVHLGVRRLIPTVEETWTHSWTPLSLQRRPRRLPCDSDSHVLPEFNGFTSTEFHDNLAGGFCRPDRKHDIGGATIIRTLVSSCTCI